MSERNTARGKMGQKATRSKNKRMAAGEHPEWEKVSRARICERIKNIDALARLDDDTVSALAAAICIACRLSPELGRLLSRAKVALCDLEMWLSMQGEAPEFRADLKHIIDQVDYHHFTSFTLVIVPGGMSNPRNLHYVDEHLLDNSGPTVPTSSVPPAEERTILIPHPRRTRTKMGLEPLLFHAMGVLRAWLDTDSSWHGKDYSATRHSNLVLRKASEWTAQLLDEFLGHISTPEGIFPTSPSNVRKQYKIAVGGYAAMFQQPTKLLLDQIRENEVVVQHAWLPARQRTS